MRSLIYALLILLVLSIFVSCAKQAAETPKMEEKKEETMQEKTDTLNPETKAAIATIESQSDDYEKGFHEESMKDLFAQSNAQKITWVTADGQTIEVDRGELS